MMMSETLPQAIATEQILLRGRIQGVGMRPFLYREAQRWGLKGFCRNDGDGVEVVLTGPPEHIENFMEKLREQPPRGSRISGVQRQAVALRHDAPFVIRDTMTARGNSSQLEIPLDRVPCEKCLEEWRDPNNRRYQYPFMSCVDCGPRYTLLARLPFDRQHTSLARFPLCEACREEYQDPSNRRFHCQTISCPTCGPQLAFAGPNGPALARRAIDAAVETLATGQIIAVKAVGGYQLVCSAGDNLALQRLRDFKQRPDKPLAVMVDGIQMAKSLAVLEPAEKEALLSSPGPIVIVKKSDSYNLATEVSGALDTVGIMLPGSPLQLALAERNVSPLVVTSANVSGGPMIIDDVEAKRKLEEVCGGILTHDCDIQHRADDSVWQFVQGRRQILRHGRGTSPFYGALPQKVGQDNPHFTRPTLACGPHSNNTLALGKGRRWLIGAHVGTLNSCEAQQSWRDALASMCLFAGFNPKLVLTDKHPEYGSTKLGAELGLPRQKIQHHQAHIMATVLEHNIRGTALGVAWDGSGLGEERVIWGGEFFRLDGTDRKLVRIGSFRPFCLLGGEQAIKEPRRSAYALLSQLAEDTPDRVSVCAMDRATDRELLPLRLLESDLERTLFAVELKKATTTTTSVGRLFDGVAALLGVCRKATYSGQAPQMLEAIADSAHSYEPLPFRLDSSADGIEVDWRPTWQALVDLRQEVTAGILAARWHHTLVAIILKMAERLGTSQLVLGGGVFANRTLLTTLLQQARYREIAVAFPQGFPAGDGGLAIGQLGFAAWSMEG